MNKQCFKCRETKPLSEFYAHKQMGDGHLGKCKTCTKRDVAEREGRLRNNPDWLTKERARCREKQERYRQRGLAVQPTKEVRQRWVAKNAEKIKAHHISSQALKRGAIKKPEGCQFCGVATTDLEKHHPDYSKPLDVLWLCTKCHGMTRRKVEIVNT